MKEVSQLVNDIVYQMDCTTIGTFTDQSGIGLTCRTKWMRTGKEVTIQGVPFKIVGVMPDIALIIPPAVENQYFPAGEVQVNLRAPLYLYGTRLATNLEWTKKTPKMLEKTPIIWLYETTRETVYGRGSSYERELELRVYFLDETSTNYKTEEHRREVVVPMMALAQEFIDTIGRMSVYKRIEDYSMTTFSRFGVEQAEGMLKNILDANLSGVELRLNLTKYKEKCKC